MKLRQLETIECDANKKILILKHIDDKCDNPYIVAEIFEHEHNKDYYMKLKDVNNTTIFYIYEEYHKDANTVIMMLSIENNYPTLTFKYSLNIKIINMSNNLEDILKLKNLYILTNSIEDL